MRKVILGVAVSLDSFIEGPNGEYDWCFTDQDYGLSTFFKRIDTVFVGRKTYEMSLGMEGGGAGFPKFKEYIFSTTLDKVKEGATLIKGDIKAEVEKIKKERGKDILNRYNKAQNNFSHFTTENGLPDNQIYSLVCDNNGMLWMGTNRGLCRFNPLDYTYKNFTGKDGIQNYEYNTGAALKLKDGTLLIGGITGYNIIHPDKIENKASEPPVVVISSFKIFDKETPTGDGQLKLKYKENSLAFEFAELSYNGNEQNHYAYQLEGVDPEWVYSDTRRYVSYSRLKPGDYTFHVKASNADGVWNESGAQLKSTISPPWWLTWWAYTFYTLLILCTVYAIFDVYKKRLLLKLQIESEHGEAIRLKELDTFKS